MKERPIIFSGPMIQAILDGRKTQTRRPVKPQPQCFHSLLGETSKGFVFHGNDHPNPTDSPNLLEVVCPYGRPGDLLWVRETHHISYDAPVAWPDLPHKSSDLGVAYYRQGFDRSQTGIRWRPSIHMPRWASRINLLINSVRVERVQDIGEEDAIDEGIDQHMDDGVMYYGDYGRGYADPKMAFRALWDTIYSKKPEYNWQSNPWVWVIKFEVKK